MTAEGALVDGRYRLDQPIGRGRAGMVWLAFDTRLHRTVAAKRMYVPSGLQHSLTENARAIALNQGRAATKIVHSCAITVHDAFADGKDVWLIMEYVPSRNMADFLTEHGRLTPEQAASLGVQLGSALSAAHGIGIAHGSLEPGNVLLADDGGVKISDFGITGAGPDPAFRAPELANGGTASPASDAYALGATLYAAVEGVPPFGADGNGHQAPPTHSGVLTGALLKLLRTDPGSRPTLTDTLSSLNAITKGNRNAIVPPTAPPGTRFPGGGHQPQAQPATPQAHQPAQQQPVQQPQRQAVPPHRPARGTAAPALPRMDRRSAARKWLLTAVAVLLAIAVGILFAELVLLS